MSDRNVRGPDGERAHPISCSNPDQTSLHYKYREEHGEACDAVLTRLEPADRDRIDGLFFEATIPTDAAAH